MIFNEILNVRYIVCFCATIEDDTLNEISCGKMNAYVLWDVVYACCTNVAKFIYLQMRLKLAATHDVNDGGHY